jgi:hypothetical protein
MKRVVTSTAEERAAQPARLVRDATLLQQKSTVAKSKRNLLKKYNAME